MAKYGINDMPKGWYGENKINKTIYGRWKTMMHRCYNPKMDRYKYYGAKGYYVEESLHYLSNYVDTLKKDPLWKDFIKNPNIYDIDKDMSQKEEDIKVYSRNTIRIILKIDNIRDGNSRHNYENTVKHTDYIAFGKAVTERQSIPIKATNLSTGEVRYYFSAKEATKDGFNNSHIRRVCKGILKQHKGWLFEDITKEEYYDRKDD